MKFELKHVNPSPGADQKELSNVVLARFGLIPRKKDAKAAFNKLLLEFYERKKQSLKDKKPELAIMSIDEMALYSNIKRQTMYDYLKRWLSLALIKKASFARGNSIIRGYELNGSNLENAFRKAETIVQQHILRSIDYINDLQNEVKKDKLRAINQEPK